MGEKLIVRSRHSRTRTKIFLRASGTYVWAPKYSLFLLMIRKEMLCLRTFLPTSVKNNDQKERNVLRTNILRNGKIRKFTKKKFTSVNPN